MATNLFPSLSSYNISPMPQGGQGAYGAVPGATGLPPNVYQQLNDITPNLGAMTGLSAANIQSELSGQLDPNVISQIQNQAAARGIASGMPGSGLSENEYLKSLGLSSMQLQQQGQKDYLSFLSGVGGTLTNPQLAAGLSQSNAMLASAPDPTKAAAALEGTFLSNLKAQAALGRPIGGGYGGGIPSSSQYGAGNISPYSMANVGGGYYPSNSGIVGRPVGYAPTLYGSDSNVNYGYGPWSGEFLPSWDQSQASWLDQTTSDIPLWEQSGMADYKNSPTVDYTNAASGGDYFGDFFQ